MSYPSNYDKFIVDLAPELRESLVCPVQGHRRKEQEYICLSPSTTERLACFHCLLDSLASHFRYVQLLPDYLEKFNDKKAQTNLYQQHIDSLNLFINKFPQALQAKIERQEADYQKFIVFLDEIKSTFLKKAKSFQESSASQEPEQEIEQIKQRRDELNKLVSELPSEVPKDYDGLLNYLTKKQYLQAEIKTLDQRIKEAQKQIDKKKVLISKMEEAIKALVENITSQIQVISEPMLKQFAFHRSRTHLNRSTLPLKELTNTRSIQTQHKKSIYVIIFLENQSLFATASDDSDIGIYQTESGQLQRQFTGHSDRIWTMIRLASNHLATGSSDRDIRVWNYKTGSCVLRLVGHTGFVCALLELPDNVLVSGGHDKTIRFWNSKVDEEFQGVQTVKQTRQIISSNQERIMTMIMVGVNELAVGSENKVKIYYMDSGKQKSVLFGHSSLLRDLTLLEDYKTLVTSSDDKTIRIWDLTTGETIKELTGHKYSANRTVQYDHDTLVSVSDDSQIKFWSISTGKELHSLKGHSSWVIYSTIMNEGTLVTVGADKQIKFWSQK